MSRTQQQKASELQNLNKDGIYVLPNAWDAGSAVLTANLGAKVVATSSAGVSWAKGRPDGQNMTRTDVYLAGIGEPAGRYDESLRRARAYATAGADMIFVPGLTDLEVIARLVEESPIPVNIMAGPGAPTVSELARAGVRRVSLGASVAHAAYSLVARATREVLTEGTYTQLSDVEPWDVIDGGFAGR